MPTETVLELKYDAAGRAYFAAPQSVTAAPKNGAAPRQTLTVGPDGSVSIRPVDYSPATRL